MKQLLCKKFIGAIKMLLKIYPKKEKFENQQVQNSEFFSLGIIFTYASFFCQQLEVYTITRARFFTRQNSNLPFYRFCYPWPCHNFQLEVVVDPFLGFCRHFLNLIFVIYLEEHSYSITKFICFDLFQNCSFKDLDRHTNIEYLYWSCRRN